MRSQLSRSSMLCLLGANLTMTAACSAPAGSSSSASSCLKDTDCKGDRLCISGECVDLRAATAEDGTPAADVTGDSGVVSQKTTGSVTPGGGTTGDGGTTPTASPLSCSGSKQVSCFEIDPRGETVVDRISLESGESFQSSGWILFSGSDIFSFRFLGKPTSGAYQVEPYSSSDVAGGHLASLPISLAGVHAYLHDSAHASKDHYLATSGTIHMNVEGTLLLADWDDLEVRSAERESNFLGGRSRGHLVYHEGSEMVSSGGSAGGGSN